MIDVSPPIQQGTAPDPMGLADLLEGLETITVSDDL